MTNRPVMNFIIRHVYVSRALTRLQVEDETESTVRDKSSPGSYQGKNTHSLCSLLASASRGYLLVAAGRPSSATVGSKRLVAASLHQSRGQQVHDVGDFSIATTAAA